MVPVLGVRHLATIEEVTEAYEKISLKWYAFLSSLLLYSLAWFLEFVE